MNSVDTNAVLNRLRVIHNRSLPTYLSSAVPWSRAGGEAASETLAQIAEDHKTMVDRLGQLILENGGVTEPGSFPLEFTSLHYLSLDFLMGKLIETQQELIREIEDCVQQLHLSPSSQAVAQEALGEAKGHLESLKELAADAAVPDSEA